MDAANDGDVIKVATGVYTGGQGRTAPAGYDGPSVITQVVYISKTVTVRGGYTTAFTDPPDPEANPTTLDAQGQGRVLFIGGNVSPTIEGLRITGGDAAGLGGDPYGDAGGGMYVVTASNSVSRLTATTTITITDVPVAGLAAANDSLTELGDVTTLTATITAGSNVSYTWAFGDGQIGSGAVVTHTYPDLNVYTAIVTASNSVGRVTAPTTVTITTAESYIYLPLVLRNS